MGVTGVASILPPAILLLHLSLHVAGGHLHPLILVPGIDNSRIEARLTDAYLPSNSSLCGANRPEGWFRLWKDRLHLTEPAVRCFAEQMALHYDPDADDYHNTPGVETLASHFGSVEGFRHLDPDDHMEGLSELATLLERLEKAGYRDGEDLFGAPYDFRHGLAADGHPSRVGTQFLRDLTALVEHASAANGGLPVVLVTHSLGSLFALHLLNRNPPHWRHRFVKQLVALAPPWGGGAWAAFVFASGNLLPGVKPSTLRAVSRSYESLSWLLPSPKHFGGKPLVVTPRRNYSATDLPEFLADVGCPEAVRPYRSRVLPVAGRWEPPGVPVTCVFGTGVPTPEVFLYGDGFEGAPEIVCGYGDGTVNLQSLLAVEEEWSGVPEQPLRVVKVPNATHGSILVHEVTWGLIMEQVSGDDDPHVSSFAV
uniref:Lecithin-cholesterol acyltransferase-like 1 n=1 Tax=Anthurium amnicola TaxID=1678845 RepID=A0A1D1ZHL6_9ARAE